jgi:DNA-binding NarL/FixJ family response regulator
MIRIVILDNYTFYRLGVKSVFEGNPHIHVAGEALDGTNLFDFLTHTPVDVVLMGVNQIDDIGYVDIVRRLHCHFPAVKVLVVADEETDDIVHSMMEARIDGYIGKRQANREKLEKAIQKTVKYH